MKPTCTTSRSGRPELTRDEERELLEAILSGDRARWGDFISRYERLIGYCVRRVLARYVGAGLSDEDVEDVISDVWLAILGDDLRRLRKFNEARGVRLASWLGLIATNQTIDYLRTRARPAMSLDDLATGEHPVAGERPDQLALEQEQAAMASAAFATLSAEDRAFLAACFEKERTPTELAARLGISVNTVYSRKFKVQAKLAKIVREMDNTDPVPRRRVSLGGPVGLA